MYDDENSREEREEEQTPARRPAGGRHQKPNSRRPGRRKRAVRTVLIVVAALVLVVVLALVFLFQHMYGLMNVRSGREEATATPQADTTPTATDTPEPTATPEPLTEEELAALEEQMLKNSLQEEAEEILYDEDVYNILLLGSDSRVEGSVERSDAMIMVSVNKRTQEIWLTSFMRDTLVTIPDWGSGHLNWATSIGGVDMLISTLESEKNFAIQVDNWALVDFVSFAEIAEMIGGITVYVPLEEIANINAGVLEVARMMGVERTYLPEEEGTYDLNGIQTLAYIRERKINGDTGRSARQREALIQLWDKVKQMSLTEQYELAEKIMSTITTDLTRGECLSLLLSAPSFLQYDIYTQQCPVAGSFWRGRDYDGLSIYNADFAVNRNFLRATIYGEEMTQADLTSSWTGSPVLVWWPEEEEAS